MSLIEVRERLARESGRHDLVKDFAGGDYSDSGNGVSNRLINDAQRLLDRKASFIKAYSWHKKDVSVGTYRLNFRYCSAIKEVWFMPDGGDRYKLAKKSLSWIRAEYGGAYSEMSEGTPLYYAPRIVNLGPDQVDLTSQNYTDEFSNDYEEILFSDEGEHFLYNGVLWMPPNETAGTISVLGRFWSPPLSDDNDKSFWTEVHPDILSLAAQYVLERTYRNREGMADYMSAILDALDDLDREVVEEEAQDLDQMEG